jgi:hypothetical protein
MKKSVWKTTVRSIISVFLLIVLVRANGGSGVNGPSSSVLTFAGNPQHTATYQPPAQNLNVIQWSTTIDLNPGDFAHYGAPLVTAANTVITPLKTATDGFQVKAIDGNTGSLKYTLTTDYVLPNHDWIPVYNPCVTTGSFGTRLYYAGRGGTMYHIDNPDAVAHGTPVQEVFYTTLANYQANAAAYNAAIFINTPITADSNGNVFFGFRVQGTAPAPLSTTQSGYARIDPNGNASYVLTGAAAANNSINRNSHNSAPALSNDQTTLYVVAKSSSSGNGYLIALNSTTLATRNKIFLQDPRSGKDAAVSDDSTASPTVAPDDDVYLGILANPGNGSRGFLLRFSGDLTVEKTPGGFGWDYTPAIVPASMVPSYQGPSSYLIFAKYNNYAGFGDGDGVNRIAILDPNVTQLDGHKTANGLVEMREILSITGPSPDPELLSVDFPYAVREWCINTAAVNPATNSVYMPSEDGHIYSWNLATNSLSQGVQLNAGIGQPYVPTIIGPNGVIYTLNGGNLFALGGYTGVGVTLTSSMPDNRPVVVGQSLTFTATITNTGTPGPVPSGTVTFQDRTYQDTTPVTTTLASNVLLDANGQATVTTSSLTAGNGFLGNHHITAVYSGDGNFSAGSATLVQKVHARGTTTALTSSPNPSTGGQLVSFTATVSSTPASSTFPSGMVTFQEGATVLGQIPVNGSGVALLDISTLGGGSHMVTAVYASDTVFASSNGSTTQTVNGGSTPTPTPALTPTPTPGPTSTPTPSGTATPGPTSTPITPSPGHAINLSTRMHVQTGDNAGIGGFIITGSNPKHVLLRGIGPSLAPGISDVLANPTLDLRDSTGVRILANNDWRDTQEAEIMATGIPPSNNLEAAIVETLDPGNYTVILRGMGMTSGVGLVEVYDLDPDATSKLGNLSTRALVGSGNDVVIAGFILGTTSVADTIIVRGVGPSLTEAGVPNALANPTLELRDGNGTLLLTNNDWQDNPAQAAQLVAANLAPANQLESGMATTLPPGLYTALLGDLNNGTGVGLVEVYDIIP